MIGLRSEFTPRTGWRWWLHFGANENRLMYPPLPSVHIVGIFPELSRCIEALAVQIGQLFQPIFEDMSKTFEQIGRFYFGEG